jgi:hypothetical protein
MDVLIACHLNNRRQNTIDGLIRLVEHLEDHPCLLTTPQYAITTGINETGIAYLNSLTGNSNRCRSLARSTAEVLIETEKTVVTTVGAVETAVVCIIFILF